MKKFLVFAESCKSFEIEAATAEMAYRAICSFCMPETQIIITDRETGLNTIFTRDLDKDGNLVRVNKEEM